MSVSKWPVLNVSKAVARKKRRSAIYLAHPRAYFVVKKMSQCAHYWTYLLSKWWLISTPSRWSVQPRLLREQTGSQMSGAIPRLIPKLLLLFHKSWKTIFFFLLRSIKFQWYLKIRKALCYRCKKNYPVSFMNVIIGGFFKKEISEMKRFWMVDVWCTISKRWMQTAAA